MADYSANIRIGVTGLDQLNKVQSAVNKLSQQLEKRFAVAIKSEDFDKIGVTLNRVANTAAIARKNLENVNVNNWAELRGAVKRVVDTLELQRGVQAKINRELDEEIAKRNQLKTAVQRNIAESQQSRQASNFGFGNAGDPVAKSVARNQRNQERIFGAANARGAAVDAANAMEDLLRKERQYFLEVQQANEALYLRSEIIKRFARDQYARDRAVSQDFGVNPVRTLRPAGVSDEDVARRNADAARGRLANVEAENLSAIERRIALRNEETEILNRQAALLKQQAVDQYARGKSLSRDFGVNPVRTLRPAGVSDEDVIGQNIGADQNRRLNSQAVRRRAAEFRLEQRRQQAEDRAAAQAEREQARLAAQAEQRRQQRRKRLTGGIQETLIGGAFPLLFGQGAGTSIGGAIGGSVGFLGPGAGFAGGLVGSAIGQQFDNLKKAAVGMAEALREPTALLEAMGAAGITTSTALKNTVAALEATGRGAEAQALVFAELERLGGSDYVQDLLELEEANKELQAAWSELSVAIQEELLPAFILLTKAAKGFADFIANSDVLTRWAGIVQASPGGAGVGLIGRLLQGQGIGEAANNTGQQVQDGLQRLLTGQGPETADTRNRQPQLSDTQQRRDLDEAIARQKEAEDLRRQGASLERDAADFRRDQEEAIFGFRRRAMQIEREVTEFRKGLEDKIFAKRQENQRKEAELARQVAQLSIERQDLALSDAGRIPAEQGGGRSPLVDAVREYLRTRAEGEADLQQKEINTQLEVASIQRATSQLEADITKKVVDLREKADDYKRDTDKFAYDTAKKIYDFQIKAADYQYAQWERTYKLAADLQQKQAAALQSSAGPVESFTSNASRGKALIGIGQRLGINPLDLALVIQAESGGNPNIVGGAGGNYQGLIQFGPSERRQYGYRRGMGFEEQLAPGGPVENYLRDRFRGAGRSTQGASLLDLYTTVLAGNPGANPDARDSFGNSARSQVAKIQRERESVRQRYFTTSVPNALGTPIGAVVGGPPVNASAVAGPAPRVPTIAPLGTPPRLGKLPDFDAERKQLSELDQRAAQLAEQLLENERKAVELRNLAAESRLEDATAAALQGYLQPLIDANQQLEDRAAYEREYGELIQNGALPALAEQLAAQRELEKTQLRSLEIQEKAVEASIATAKARLIEKGISEEELALRERALKKLLEIRDALEGGRTAIANQSSQAEQRILDANSPDARRNRAVTGYQERINALQNTPLRAFEKLQEAKADLAELIDPLNQITSAAEAIGSAFGDAFQSILSGSESADEALKKMFANIGSYFLNMAAQILAQQALTSILGLLSGGAGAAAGGGGGSGFQTGGLFNLKLPGFAEGGVPPVNKPSIVGENGPELFIPGVTGTIVPNKDLRNAPLLPADQMMTGDTATPEINYTGQVLNFNGSEYVSKKDVPKIIAASSAATGSKMRNSVSFRRRAGI